MEIPRKLADHHIGSRGEIGRAWIAQLPALADTFMNRWGLRLDGAARHGMVALVLPVLRQDGTPAALKLHPIEPEHPGEAAALRTWSGEGAVQLIEEEETTDSYVLLLERLDASRSLRNVPDVAQAIQVIGELLVRLNSHRAPPEARDLNQVIEEMLAEVPRALASLGETHDRRTLRGLSDRVGALRGQAGDRLLHWDLHYDNVLSAQREPWLAIDPKPLAGDPGFELLPALRNRWDEVIAGGDTHRAVRRRFDQLTEVMALDRSRATVWTLARVLQDALWEIEDGATRINTPGITIAEALMSTENPGDRYTNR